MTDYKKFIAVLEANSVIPVVVIDNLEDTLPLADALINNGCNIIEITLRTAVGMQAIELLKRERPQMLTGAGTVCSKEQFLKMESIGVDFIVSPGSTPELLEVGASANIPYLPGVMTSSEILRAMNYGYKVLKFFPAALAGGIGGLKTYGSVYSDVLFCPTGGITGDNYKDFLALKNVVALGGTWLAKQEDIVNQQWADIAARVQRCYGR
ncbi:MAG: bifunctional 4-hydroxy-2-oxoglutarate aldolase/2-dehydro-3-deoxy-phosphogluconate aldolase [Negativicutes bacterium]|jgi:2-dehydro-3-deoxyphosphogluconate aldolase/(4S)-4-hydroxy-2-oxoglutarate aldolase